MKSAAQPEVEILPETYSDWINDLSDEACRLHDEAVEAYGAGRPDEAEDLFRRALALFEQAEGPEHIDVAAVLGNLGALLEDQCDYPAAEECYVRAAAITEAIEDDAENYEDNQDVARLRLQSLDNLGRIHRTQGSYAQADPVIRRALGFAERTFGSESLETSGALNNLGMLGKFAGWFDEAADCYRRALAILEKHFGEDCAEAASIYHNLGGLEHARGRFAEGEPFARKSVELRRQVYGDRSPEVAADIAALAALCNYRHRQKPTLAEVAADIAALAALLDGQGKYEESEALYHRALQIFRRAHGEEHYEIAVNLNNLAALYVARGREAEAEKYYRQSLAIKEKLFGADNLEVALTMNNLAALYEAQERFDEAEYLYRRALATFESALEAKHPNLAACRENYTRLRRK
jgi:tetratricopeptide (TPR) repeat protein